MTTGVILLSVALYLGVILSGLAAGVVVNALADRVAPTPGPSPAGGRGEVLGERRDDGEGDDKANDPNVAFRHPISSGASPLPPAGEGPGVGATRRRVTPLALGALFPLLLAHALATRSHAPGHLPTWAIFVTQAVCVVVLVGVFVIDLEHRLIFDVAIFPLGGGLLALALLADRRALLALALGAALAGGIFLLFYGLGFLLYRQEAMGFGDVKLAALVGLIVGWPGITTALLATAIVGAIASMLLLAFSDISRRAFIPFGVFLAVGAVVGLLATPPVW
ncbi:MAG TPA: A24 family peptidase [Ktedonobacterales bacterium]|nr:A24 family peptidase [Ktedonobacterales bacterium]